MTLSPRLRCDLCEMEVVNISVYKLRRVLLEFTIRSVMKYE